MDADAWCREVCESYFTQCLAHGQIMYDGDRDTWVTETVGGASLSDLDDTSLIDLADKGLNEYGEYAITSEGGVRAALDTLAVYALIHDVIVLIAEAMDAHDLEDAQELSDSPPGDESRARAYDGETHVDGPLWVWGHGDDRRVWKHIEELGFWVEFTDCCPPSAVEEMGDAVDEDSE